VSSSCTVTATYWLLSVDFTFAVSPPGVGTVAWAMGGQGYATHAY
jgi:hypothetical protein